MIGCRAARWAAMLLCIIVSSSCTLIPAKRPQGEAAVPQWEITPLRVTGYVCIGLPRDVLDFPFTVVNRLLYYKTANSSG